MRFALFLSQHLIIAAFDSSSVRDQGIETLGKFCRLKSQSPCSNYTLFIAVQRHGLFFS